VAPMQTLTRSVRTGATLPSPTRRGSGGVGGAERHRRHHPCCATSTRTRGVGDRCRRTVGRSAPPGYPPCPPRVGTWSLAAATGDGKWRRRPPVAGMVGLAALAGATRRRRVVATAASARCTVREAARAGAVGPCPLVATPRAPSRCGARRSESSGQQQGKTHVESSRAAAAR